MPSGLYAWGNALHGDFKGGSMARRTRPPCRPRAGLMPRGGIWGYMLDTGSISWHLDPSDRVVITPYRIRNAGCVWSDSRAELATALSQQQLRFRLS